MLNGYVWHYDNGNQSDWDLEEKRSHNLVVTYVYQDWNLFKSVPYNLVDRIENYDNEGIHKETMENFIVSADLVYNNL